MRLRRVICGACAAAALVTGAVATASASAAAPEYGRCLKVTPVGKTYPGGFTNSSCTNESASKTGKYEWYPGPGPKAKFTTSGGVGLLSTVGGVAVECKSESSGGELKPGNNKEQAGIVVTFKGCEAQQLPCTSLTATHEGELITNELEGAIGWESKAKKKTDLELRPAKSVASGLFIEFTCSGLRVKVRGHVLVPFKNDKMTETETLKYKATKGKQKPEKWEESSEPAILEASFSNFNKGAYEQAGQNITATVKVEEKLELNAVV